MQILPRVLAAVKAVLRRLGLLPYVRRLVARLAAPGNRLPAARSLAYFIRVLQEKSIFAEAIDIHQLPGIYHYWSNTYLLPKVRRFGFSSPDEFFANHLERSLAAGRSSRFLSIGSGNCDTEVRVAQLLRSRGHSSFVIECLDLNPVMLRRGAELARQRAVSGQLAFVEGDFNRWTPEGAYDAVMANQALHHVLELEHLFASVAAAISHGGRFIVSDMIGRNGHLRWPEALEVVREFWRELPQSHRYNNQLSRQEDVFLDWDCSMSGFEGIRAQDILPLLVRDFHFEVFLPFANVIDPFIDRAFGPNFDPNSDRDRAFIDRVHARDERELESGRIKPTHLFAVLAARPVDAPQFLAGYTPEGCIRAPGPA